MKFPWWYLEGMPVDVHIPPVLRSHSGGDRAVQTSPGTIRDIIEELGARHPGLAGQILAEDGELHRFVNLYVNDEDVRYLDGLDTEVLESDVVSILPAVAGGR